MVNKNKISSRSGSNHRDNSGLVSVTKIDHGHFLKRLIENTIKMY